MGVGVWVFGCVCVCCVCVGVLRELSLVVPMSHQHTSYLVEEALKSELRNIYVQCTRCDVHINNLMSRARRGFDRFSRFRDP